MSMSAAESKAGPIPADGVFAGARVYLFGDTRRTLQTVLGLLWLLDGGLQFQAFMYSRGFISMLTSMAAGQPGWLHGTIIWAAHLIGRDLTVFNTLFALTQVALGLGILSRATVKAALLLSVGWAFVVWWFGEAFGMLFMNMARPLAGAPGAAVLYALVALAVWPNHRPGGLLGVRAVRTLWAGLWLLQAWLWLEAPSSSANAVTNALNAAPSGMSWLSSLQDACAGAARGHGLIIALLMAALSAGIALAGGLNWQARPFLIASMILSLAFWLIGQGFGGIFQGGATDPNSAPLFILLAFVVLWLVPHDADARAQPLAH